MHDLRTADRGRAVHQANAHTPLCSILRSYWSEVAGSMLPKFVDRAQFKDGWPNSSRPQTDQVRPLGHDWRKRRPPGHACPHVPGLSSAIHPNLFGVSPLAMTSTLVFPLFNKCKMHDLSLPMRLDSPAQRSYSRNYLVSRCEPLNP